MRAKWLWQNSGLRGLSALGFWLEGFGFSALKVLGSIAEVSSVRYQADGASFNPSCPITSLSALLGHWIPPAGKHTNNGRCFGNLAGG